MHYEINVALHKSHFFATSDRSITTMAKLREVHAEIAKRFPVEDGFKITVTEWYNSGREIDPTTIK